MKPRKNRYPFIILFIIHTGLLLYTFYKKKDRKTLSVLLLTNIGLAYLFEYIVLNLFNAYHYKPKMMKANYLDNIFGAILSQGIFVPFTGVFLTAFRIGLWGKSLFGFYFIVIEVLFKKANIYHHHWWKTIYSFILIPFFFFISDFWYKQLKLKNPTIMLSSLYLCTLVTGINLLYIMVLLRDFRFGFGGHHSWREHFILSPLYCMVLSLSSTWAIRKEGWLPKLTLFIFPSGIDWILYKTGLVKKNFRIIFENVFIHGIMLLFASQFHTLIYGKSSK